MEHIDKICRNSGHIAIETTQIFFTCSLLNIHVSRHKTVSFCKKVMNKVVVCLLKEKKINYGKTCLKGPLKNRQNKGLKDRLSLNAGQKYCRMLPLGAFCNIFDLH